MIYDIMDDPILQDSNQELGTLLIMLESWNLVHKSWITYQDDTFVKDESLLQESS